MQICFTMHIFLNVPTTICFFLKCPLIGCTVTVSCFNSPLWNLNVACLTSRPRGENLVFASFNHLLLTVFSIISPLSLCFCFQCELVISFSSMQHWVTENKIRSVSTPSHNPELFCVFCVCVCVTPSAIVRPCCQHGNMSASLDARKGPNVGL